MIVEPQPAPANAYLPNSEHKAAHRICDLCFRECGGFCVQYRAERQFPAYHTCSDLCDDIVLEMVIADRGYLKRAAIAALNLKAAEQARKTVYDALLAIGIPRGAMTLAVLDAIIKGTFTGIVRSMRAQSAGTVYVEPPKEDWNWDRISQP